MSDTTYPAAFDNLTGNEERDAPSLASVLNALQQTIGIEGAYNFGSNTQAYYIATSYGPGATDINAAINAAIDVAISETGGGTIIVPAAKTPYVTSNGVDVSTPNISIWGEGADCTQIDYTGPNDCWRIHTNPFSISQAGSFGGVTLDGSRSQAGASGFHYGDIIGGGIDQLVVQNFDKSGSINIWFDNVTNWTERTHIGRMWSSNGTVCIAVTVNGGMTSFARQTWGSVMINTLMSDQIGLHVQDDANCYAWDVNIGGNLDGTGAIGLSLDAGSSISGMLNVQMEGSSGTQGFNLAGNVIGVGSLFFFGTDTIDSTATGSFAFNGSVNVPGIWNQVGGAVIAGGLQMIPGTAPGNTGMFVASANGAVAFPVVLGDNSVTYIMYPSGIFETGAIALTEAGGAFDALDTAGIGTPDGNSVVVLGSAGQIVLRPNAGGAGQFIIQPDGTPYFGGPIASTATGGAVVPPADVVGYLEVNIDGTARKIPYYAT